LTAAGGVSFCCSSTKRRPSGATSYPRAGLLTTKSPYRLAGVVTCVAPLR
jgi:hypothetical protein